MPFQKVNFCMSTQVAMNAFHMFRNGTINRATKDWGDTEYTIQPTGMFEGEDYPSGKELTQLENLLGGTYHQMRVYDVVTLQTTYHTEERRVDFIVDDEGRCGRCILTVYVRRMYLNGDEVSGYTAWRVSSLQVEVIKFFDQTGQRNGSRNTVKFSVIRHDIDHILTKRMQDTFDGTVYIHQ